MKTKKLKWVKCFESDNNEHFMSELQFGDETTCIAYKISNVYSTWTASLQIGLYKTSIIRTLVKTKEEAQKICQENYENWILSQLDDKTYSRPLYWEPIPKQKDHFVADLYNGINYMEFGYEIREEHDLWIAAFINDSIITEISKEYTQELAKLVCQGHYTRWLRTCIKKTYIKQSTI